MEQPRQEAVAFCTLGRDFLGDLATENRGPDKLYLSSPLLLFFLFLSVPVRIERIKSLPVDFVFELVENFGQRCRSIHKVVARSYNAVP